MSMTHWLRTLWQISCVKFPQPSAKSLYCKCSLGTRYACAWTGWTRQKLGRLIWACNYAKAFYITCLPCVTQLWVSTGLVTTMYASRWKTVWWTQSNFLGLLPKSSKEQWDCEISNYYVALPLQQKKNLFISIRVSILFWPGCLQNILNNAKLH